MHRSSKMTAVGAFALLAVSGPVRADVTPQQVWDDLAAYMQSFGYTVTATQSGAATDLTVSDVTMSMDLPEDGGSVSFSMPEVVLSDRGDGSVLVTFPEVMPIRIVSNSDDAEDVEATINYEQTGLEMIVSGDPDDLLYAYTADALSLRLADLTVEGAAVPREAARGVLSMSGLEGQTRVSVGDKREMSQSMTFAGATYDVAFTDPEGGGNGLFKGTMANVSLEADSSLPVEMDTTDMAAMMEAGVAGSGTFRYEDGKTEFAVTENGQTTSGQLSSDTAMLSVEMTADALAYETGNTNMSVNITSPDMPFPIAATMEQTGISVALPVAAAEEPQDFSLMLTLAGFTMSEMLWNVFDPGAALPRDAATIKIDLQGLATPFVSLFDPEAMAALETSGEPPAELNALTLNDLTVQAAGAKLTGTGEFTFNNEDLETFDGMPAPSGTAELELTGSNALIDKLIGMGLLKQEDAMGARMMMSMFTVPAGDDQLRSTIEVREDGQVLANGQRIR